MYLPIHHMTVSRDMLPPMTPARMRRQKPCGQTCTTLCWPWSKRPTSQNPKRYDCLQWRNFKALVVLVLILKGGADVQQLWTFEKRLLQNIRFRPMLALQLRKSTKISSAKMRVRSHKQFKYRNRPTDGHKQWLDDWWLNGFSFRCLSTSLKTHGSNTVQLTTCAIKTMESHWAGTDRSSTHLRSLSLGEGKEAAKKERVRHSTGLCF